MRDSYNVILINVSSKWLSPYSGGSSKFSVQVLHTFPGVPRSLNYIVAKLHLNHCKASPCVFNYPFFPFDHSFVLPEFFMKVLHDGSSRIPFILILFFKILFRGVQAFFILHPKVQFVLSYLLRWCYVIFDNFPSCFMIHKLSRMRYFKSINLVIGVILGYFSPKNFP